MHQVEAKATAVTERVLLAVGNSGSFLLAAIATLALTLSTAFYNYFPSTRLGIVLLGILVLHLLRHPRVLICRETVIYIAFVFYMLVEMLWTPVPELALNTLVPAGNCVLVLVLFGSLLTFHDASAVRAGIAVGFLVGAVVYGGVVGFPVHYPPEFSYNAIAGMYLFGLIAVLILCCFRRLTVAWLLVCLVILAHVVATTSIKTNLGILLGLIVASLFYMRYCFRVLRKQWLALLISLVALGVTLSSSGALSDRLDRGLSRISLGLEILRTREGVEGYSAFGNRSGWLIDGLHGWMNNPVFGHGVEAFRSGIGITSHSTPVDLLYNSGVIGFVLFYSIFLSILWRLHQVRRESPMSLRVLIFGSVVCYLFITLSGTMHYNSFLAAFFAISVALLRQFDSQSVDRRVLLQQGN